MILPRKTAKLAEDTAFSCQWSDWLTILGNHTLSKISVVSVMRNFSIFVAFALTLLFAANAQASDKKFFSGIAGKWNGPGEIVAGKYKGTKFICTFDGDSLRKMTGMNIDGSCRVGMFSQPMSAMVRKASSRYKGQFLDGAKGDGMDVIGGRYSRSRLVVDIERKDLKGVMVANLTKKNRLNITISVHVGTRLVPVIGMSLKRIGSKKVAKNGN